MKLRLCLLSLLLVVVLDPSPASAQSGGGLLGKLIGDSQTPGQTEPAASPTAVTQRREAEIHAVYFSDGDPPTGGTSPCLLIVEPNTRRRPSVGVTQQFSSGTGQQFVGAAWMAALNACSVLEMDIADARFMLDLGGLVDGPSAGMLMTATFTALLRGDDVRADSTMTGAVNQDGTAGPVGGIPQKMQGAAAKGFKRFGYPIGNRMSMDLKSQQLVDVNDFGRALGLEVVEIRDLWDAYEFLTGKPLDRPTPVDERDMELDPAVRASLTQDVGHWASQSQALGRRIEQAFADYQAAGQLAVADPLRPMIAEAQQLYADGDSHLQGGQVAAAWRRHVEATALLNAIEAQLEISLPLSRGDVNAMSQLIQQRAEVEQRMETVYQRFSDQALGESLDGTIAAISGLANYVQGYGFLNQAKNARSQATQILEAVNQGQASLDDPQIYQMLVKSLVQPHLWYSLSASQVEIAERNLLLANPQGLEKKADPAVLSRLASGYASAAFAAKDYFMALVVQPVLDNGEMSPAQLEEILTLREGDFTSVMDATRIAASLQQGDTAQHTAADSLLGLGAGVYAYQRLSSLSNKWYCLGPQFDANNALSDFGNPTALRHQLNQGERRCREVAARCREQLGFIPESARFSYQLATAFRDGPANDKITALEAYGECVFWCQFALVVAQ